MINKEEVDQFIRKNSQLDKLTLALKLSKKPELPSEYIINQIQGRKIAHHKLPDWDNSNLIFPSKQAMEQCSSSTTAAHKSTLVNKGHKVVDLTGGFGVDTYYLSKGFQEVYYVEANDELFEISSNNLNLLIPNNKRTFVNDSAEAFLAEFADKFDLIYLDPDRRVDGIKKGVKIEDCSPNLIDLESKLLERSKQVLVKFSPLLDIKQALKQITSIDTVNIVSVNNDCKEVLFTLSKNKTDNVPINCINFTSSKEERFRFTFEEEENYNVDYSDPLKYIYEPNSAILKAGAFKSIAVQFNLKKLAINSHFYTSEELIQDFPGRCFELKTMSNQIKGLSKKANIISRNHPLTPDEIKKKGKIKDGGNDYIIATKLVNNKPVYLLCVRL